MPSQAREMGGFGCVEHLVEEPLASHRDAAPEFRCPCSVTVWGGGRGSSGIQLGESNPFTAHLSGPGLGFVCWRVKANLESASKLNMHSLS